MDVSLVGVKGSASHVVDHLVVGLEKDAPKAESALHAVRDLGACMQLLQAVLPDAAHSLPPSLAHEALSLISSCSSVAAELLEAQYAIVDVFVTSLDRRLRVMEGVVGAQNERLSQQALAAVSYSESFSARTTGAVNAPPTRSSGSHSTSTDAAGKAYSGVLIGSKRSRGQSSESLSSGADVSARRETAATKRARAASIAAGGSSAETSAPAMIPPLCAAEKANVAAAAAQADRDLFSDTGAARGLPESEMTHAQARSWVALAEAAHARACDTLGGSLRRGGAASASSSSAPAGGGASSSSTAAAAAASAFGYEEYGRPQPPPLLAIQAAAAMAGTSSAAAAAAAAGRGGLAGRGGRGRGRGGGGPGSRGGVPNPRAVARAMLAAAAAAGLGPGGAGSAGGVAEADAPALSALDMAVEAGEPLYCTCRQVAFSDMIACDNKACAVEWFHLPCVGLSRATMPTGRWFCPACRARLTPSASAGAGKL